MDPRNLDADLVLGRYRVESRIRVDGASGLLRVARDERDPRGGRVVLREVPSGAEDAFAALIGVEHENVARFHAIEFDVEHGVTLSIAEWIEGRDFAAARSDLPLAAQLGVLADALRGLEAIHALGLAHGDLKPSNVVVTPPRGGAPRGVLIDPGFEGQGRGAARTIHYLAPERIAGGKATPASDLFAIGVMLHEVLRGELPFRGDEPIALVRSIAAGVDAEAIVRGAADPALARLCARLLAQEPSQRPTSASEARITLERALGRVTEPQSIATAIESAGPLLERDACSAIDGFLDAAALALARGERPALALEGGRGAGCAALLAHARAAAARRGWLALDLDGVDPSRLPRDLAVVLDGAVLATLEIDPGEAAPARRLAAFLAATSPTGRRVLVFAGSADDVRLALPRDARVEITAATVPPLRAPSIATWLSRALPGLLGVESLAFEVERRCGGSPEEARRLIAALARRGGITMSDAGCVADPTALEVAARELERDEREAALESLPAEWVALMRWTALAEIPLGLDVALAAGVATSHELLVAAQGARRRGLTTGFAPPASLGVPDPALARALRARPRDPEVEARIGRAILRDPTQRRDGRRLLAAAQLLAPTRKGAAAALALRAADRAHSAADAALALAAANVALALRPASPRAHVARARGLSLAGRLAEADEAYRAAARASPAVALAIASEHAQALERASDPRGALAILDAALASARGDGGELTAQLRAARAWTAYAAGDAAAGHVAIAELWALRRAIHSREARLEIAAVAAALFDRKGEPRMARFAAIEARRMARALGRTSRAAHFDSTLGVFDLAAGRLRIAAHRLGRAVSRLEAGGDKRMLPDALVRLGLLEIERGSPRAALPCFERAAALFRRGENRRGEGWAENGAGRAWFELGEVERAADRFERSLALRKAAGARDGAALSATSLFRTRAALLDETGARAALREALALSVAATPLVDVLLATAEVTRDRGRIAAFRGCARRALLLVDRLGQESARSYAEVLQGEAELSRGQAMPALHRARHARSLARAAGQGPALALATALRAGALLLLERPGPARRAFAAAVKLATTPSLAAAVRSAFARAARTGIERGITTLARDGRDAAREALAAAARTGDRLVAEAAREHGAALAAALDGARVQGDLVRENRSLRQVLEASRWINEAQSLSDVLNRIIDAALELTGASRGFVVTVDDGVLHFEAARHLRRQEIERPEMQLSRSIVERAISTGETIVTSEARADERFRDFRSISELALLSVLCAPLKTREAVIGAIYVDDLTRVDRFDESDRRVIEALAEQAAIVLDKVRLRAEVEALNARLADDVAARTRELQVARSDLERARRDLAERYAAANIMSHAPQMLAIFDLIERVADSAAPVLVLGEAGTGKELIARAVHFSSFRRDKRFVTVNCAAIPDGLVEAELFGYKKGAFTGALRDREGMIASADQGTLFLDEIADMPLAIQAKLLRVLQEGEVQPLGASEPVPSRFRLVAATNKPLTKLVAEGAFREDLYWRIKVVQIDVPPLRERKGDVPLLVSHFTAKIADAEGGVARRFSDAALARLSAAPFRGNVRELEAVVRAVVLTSRADPIDVLDLPPEYRDEPKVPAPDPAPSPISPILAAPEGASLKEAVDAYERELVRRALEATGGHRGKAAEALSITRRWLTELLRKHQL
jgi:serine/threonine-protein kinase PknK